MESKINEAIGEISFVDEICLHHRLKEDLGLDSLNMVELMVKLEELFEIELEMSDLDPAQLVTVSNIHILMGKYVKVNDVSV